MRRKELSQPLFQTRPLLARHRLHRVGAHVVAATLEKLPQTLKVLDRRRFTLRIGDRIPEDIAEQRSHGWGRHSVARRPCYVQLLLVPRVRGQRESRHSANVAGMDPIDRGRGAERRAEGRRGGHAWQVVGREVGEERSGPDRCTFQAEVSHVSLDFAMRVSKRPLLLDAKGRDPHHLANTSSLQLISNLLSHPHHFCAAEHLWESDEGRRCALECLAERGSHTYVAFMDFDLLSQSQGLGCI
mmetsp:Transcript_59511/g.140153  ORF Transcript_59511/g.140153 Transcript_59511/m.140153 type:complete len:243 (-) Transcript_59511:22-750(-)